MKKHIICCGLPLSGLDILWSKLGRSLPKGVKSGPLGLAAEQTQTAKVHIATACESDLLRIDKIVAHCQAQKMRPRFIVSVRDFREILSIRHPRFPHQAAVDSDYAIRFDGDTAVSLTDPGLWPTAQALAFLLAREDLDVLVVDHHYLINTPERERLRIEAFLGLHIDASFHDPPAPLPEHVDWQAPAALQDIATVFRKAPKLQKYLRGLGFETSDLWLGRLPPRAHAEQGTIVAFYTKDSLYEAEATRMAASAQAAGLKVHLVPVSDEGSWVKNVRIKPGVLADLRERIAGQLLYVDVDAIFHADPWPYLSDCRQDVAFCVMRDGLARSGTVLLNDTPGARAFLADWQTRLEAETEAWDQTPLVAMLADNRTAPRPDYTIALLPVPLCYVFDRHPHKLANPPAVPVVEHLQASREADDKRQAPGGEARLQRRRERLQALSDDPASLPVAPAPAEEPSTIQSHVRLLEPSGPRPASGRSIYVARPRMDVSFKKGKHPVPAEEGPPTTALRARGEAFFAGLAEHHLERGDTVTIETRPLWQFDREELVKTAQRYDTLYFPHKNRDQFPIGENALYYKPSAFEDFVTVDKAGWGASLSYLPIPATPNDAAPAFFARMQERIQANQSIFEQPDLDAGAALPDSGYLLFVCQLPHDETILYHSDVTVAQALAAVIDFAAQSGQRLVVKGHPINKRSMEPLQQLTATSDAALWVEDVSIHACLAGASHVFLVNSGVGFEAMLHEKPVTAFGRAEYSSVVATATPDMDSIKASLTAVWRKTDYESFLYAFLQKAIDLRDKATFARLPIPG